MVDDVNVGNMSSMDGETEWILKGKNPCELCFLYIEVGTQNKSYPETLLIIHTHVENDD